MAKKNRTVEEVIAMLEQPNWWNDAFCHEVVNGIDLTLEESMAKAEMERRGLKATVQF